MQMFKFQQHLDCPFLYFI